MRNKHSAVTVPNEQCKTLDCPSCHATLHYYTVPKQFPHLYCTDCHNAYVDERSQKKCLAVRTDGGAAKMMSSIQSIAPLCSCGGMFLFNVGVHCSYCGEILPLPLPLKPKYRLRYDQLVVFNEATVLYNNDKQITYHLGI